MIKFSDEIARKFVHLSSLWIPISYYFFSQSLMLSILIPITILAFAIDFSRRYIPALSKLINLILGNMMRDEEKDNFALSGASYLLLASCICVYFFPKEVVIFALIILMISDTIAALVGRKYGKIKIIDKSLEGSLSFAVSAILIYLFCIYFLEFQLPLSNSLLAILMATITELYAKKLGIDDNFAIPLVICITYNI